MTLPISLTLYTVDNLPREWIDALFTQIPAKDWGHLHANIKVPDGKVPLESDPIKDKGFEITYRDGIVENYGNPYGSQPSQKSLLDDIFYVTATTSNPYTFFLLNETAFKTESKSLVGWVEGAINMLSTRPELVQVRFASNEKEVESLEDIQKALVVPDNASFLTNSWNFAPFIARTRDLNAAIRIVFSTNLSKDVAGLGKALKMLSSSPAPYAFFDPSLIYTQSFYKETSSILA